MNLTIDQNSIPAPSELRYITTPTEPWLVVVIPVERLTHPTGRVAPTTHPQNAAP